MEWTKSQDWIPFSNAAAQVFFWKDDLMKAENSLRILEQMGIPNTDPGFKLTLSEIEVSKRGLRIAQFKYRRALKRLTDQDKENFQIEV